MSSSSPPLTPIRQYTHSTDSSPMQRRPLSHRSPSFSSNRSPATPRSTYSGHRLSNSSRYSGGSHDLATPIDGADPLGAAGGGNLADELEFADEDDWDEDEVDEGVSGMSLADEVDSTWADGDDNKSTAPSLDNAAHCLSDPTQTDGARDSGIDVAFAANTPSPRNVRPSNSALSPIPQGKRPSHRNFSRPMSRASDSDAVDVFTLELEQAMAAVSRLANPDLQHQADTISRTVSVLQDLTPQAVLETHTQRLTTSTNSLSAHLMQQTRLLSSLSSSLFSPFGFNAPLDPVAIDEILPALVQVLQDVPSPDARALQALTKLDRETSDLLHTLAGLTDSLQMGRQTTSSAARHLRSTHAMVTELRRENELSEQARWKIEKDGWDRRLSERWCARECSDVVGGFEQVCEGLRQGLVDKMAA
ncbi:hypothetical protein MBLNU459_g0361t1 [Dothideomycetes sp. NU459]